MCCAGFNELDTIPSAFVLMGNFQSQPASKASTNYTVIREQFKSLANVISQYQRLQVSKTLRILTGQPAYTPQRQHHACITNVSRCCAAVHSVHSVSPAMLRTRQVCLSARACTCVCVCVCVCVRAHACANARVRAYVCLRLRLCQNTCMRVCSTSQCCLSLVSNRSACHHSNCTQAAHTGTQKPAVSMAQSLSNCKTAKTTACRQSPMLPATASEQDQTPSQSHVLQEESRFIFVPGPGDPGPGSALPRPPLPAYFTSDLRQLLPTAVFASNPCRIRLYTQEVVLFRSDLQNHMRRLCLIPPTSELLLHLKWVS